MNRRQAFTTTANPLKFQGIGKFLTQFTTEVRSH